MAYQHGIESEKVIKAARNLSAHPYLVREGEVSDHELSNLLKGLLEIIGRMENTAMVVEAQAAKPVLRSVLNKVPAIAALPVSSETHAI